MKTDREHIRLYITLALISALLLLIERLTHLEFMFHLAAIPLEILVAVFLVERFLERRRSKEKRRQLMLIKSYLFRSDMRSVVVTNFNALKFPPLTIENIRNCTLGELKRMREDANTVEYKSLEMIELVIMEYVKAQYVWQNLMERAITYDFADVFQDMIDILHFTHDVTIFKDNNPDKLFIHEAVMTRLLMTKVKQVLGNGIRGFLDYAIELREKQPSMFDAIIADY
ncbi:hypothetical protein ACFLTJ_00390 [Chloroflexota bacterium]